MRPAVWALVVLGVLLIFAGLAALAAVIAVKRLQSALEASLGQNPAGTVWEWLFSLKTRGFRDLNLAMQRAERGRPAVHPMGSTPHVDWLRDEVGFDPATLGPWPLAGGEAVDLTTVLGPRAERPLRLALPVLVAPMGYGVALSAAAKTALAQAATLAGTAVVSGEGPYLPEERAYASRWILQWSRAPWAHQASVVRLADMVDIQVGQGSEASVSIHKARSQLPSRARAALGGPLVIRAGWPDLVAEAVETIRRVHPGCPVGVKLPATHHLEEDLDVLLEYGIDVVTLDGSQGGSAGSPAVITDHFGLDIALAVHRAHRWLLARHARRHVSLVGSGGVQGAADVAKLLALGADAVAVGSSLLLAMSHEQVAPLLPVRPPTRLVFSAARIHGGPALDVDRAAEHAAAWFQASAAELVLLGQALGVRRIGDLRPWHLVARSQAAAAALGLAYDAEWSPGNMVARRVAQLVEDYRTVVASLSRIEAALGRARPRTMAGVRGRS